jgi:hypothetical protein
MRSIGKYLLAGVAFGLCLTPSVRLEAQVLQQMLNEGLVVGGWQMQDAGKVNADGREITGKKFSTAGWYSATVPGTVLTTLVDNHVYPDPMYGENNRASVIPESLAHTPFCYRAELTIPKSYAGRRVWLHFDGINYSAIVWVNGQQVGTIRGAFKRGTFDVSNAVRPGAKAILAVLVSPPPHPGVMHEHTLRDGVAKNGGITAMDGPTFLSTIGWDWLPAVPDRDTGIWQRVWLSASGPVVLKDPAVTTDLKLPGLESAGISVAATLQNVSDQPQESLLKGTINDIAFEHSVTMPAHSSQVITFDPTTDAALLLHQPKLWWPNGYGAQNLYKLHLAVSVGGKTSEEKDVTFGVRKITYTIPSTGALAFVVNGVPIFIRGGDWGLDDEMKRVPLERLDAQVRMHKLANLNMIRNWVGQSTSEDLFALCDKYGILVWDEFFQPNPSDGPDPSDSETYLDNVRDTVMRYRNHPSIAIWCGRNEGDPPKEIDAALKTMLAELDPTRLYQSNSANGRGVRSSGPYRWRAPREYYVLAEGFKSETGSMSIPTIESIQGMMPQKDWETITDDWAEHDFAKGAVSGDLYPGLLAERYGKIDNLADFVRKGQMANYEAFRAMYEGRNAEMFHPTTGILTWMSHPAHPSFVWQLYHYDLEPNSSLFAVKSASEMVHVQFNEITSNVQVVNNLPQPLIGAKVHVRVFKLDGSLSSEEYLPVNSLSSSVVDVGEVEFHEPLTSVLFVSLGLSDSAGKSISENFYWLNGPARGDRFSSLNTMPRVELDPAVNRADKDGISTFTVTLHNPSPNIALMTHLQLRRKTDNTRVLPVFYSDNYVSLIGGEDKSVAIECATDLLKGESGLVVVDGWNVIVKPATAPGIAIETNENAQVDHWPHTGLPLTGGQ